MEVGTIPPSVNQPIRAAFIDLDGTLLDPQLELPSSTARTIRAASEAGVKIIIATGRPFQSACAFCPTKKEETLVIVSNGGAVVDARSQTVVWSASMPRAILNGVYQLAKDLNLAFCAYRPTSWYATGPRELIEIEEMRSRTNPGQVVTVKKIADPIIKLMLIGKPSTLDQAKILLSPFRKTAYWFHTYAEYLEIMPRGTSKGVAVKAALTHCRIRSQEALAIGDGDNDIEMLMAVSLRIAVSNASKRLCATANYLVPSNAQDGVGIALRAFVFHEKSAISRVSKLP